MRDRIPFASLFPNTNDKSLCVSLGVCGLTVANWRKLGIPQFQAQRITGIPVQEAKKPKVTKPKKSASAKGPRNIARTVEIERLFMRGKTLQEIGDQFGITRERVRQILAKLKITGNDGGRSIRSLSLVRYKKKFNVNSRYLITYGCDKETAELLNGGKIVSVIGSSAQLYARQRQSARTRGIEWSITFPEWMRVWQESGHFNERGRGPGYCMTRIGDTGPYSVDNVEIKTTGENFSESYYKHPWEKRFPHLKRKNAAPALVDHTQKEAA